MDWIGIHNFKDIVELISWGIAAGSLLIATRAYVVGKSQFNFDVIINCTDRFQNIMAELRAAQGEDRIIALKKYIDLCNEELFYFKNKYLPEEVIDEWLEGMVFYLPIYNKSENVFISSKYAPDIVEQNLLNDYPRIKTAFSVYRRYDLSKEEDKSLIIGEIKYNLRQMAK